MQLIKDLFSVNEILTVSLLGWFVAQVLKTIINFILLGKFQLERNVGRRRYAQAHTARPRLCNGHRNGTQRGSRLLDLCSCKCCRHYHHARRHGRAA